eukprot:379557_1
MTCKAGYQIDESTKSVNAFACALKKGGGRTVKSVDSRRCVPMKCKLKDLPSAARKVHAHKSNASSPNAVDYLKTVELQCDPNYAVSGEITEYHSKHAKIGNISLSAECVLNAGKTDPKWKMSGSCERLSCTNPPIPGNARLVSQSLDTSTNITNGNATLSCATEHHVFSGTSSNEHTLMCLVHDKGRSRVTKWNQPIDCVEIQCSGQFGLPDNSLISGRVNRTLHSKTTVKCDSGYRVNSSILIQEVGCKPLNDTNAVWEDVKECAEIKRGSKVVHLIGTNYDNLTDPQKDAISVVLSKMTNLVCSYFKYAKGPGCKVSAKLVSLIDRKGTESGVSVSVEYDFPTTRIRSGSSPSYQTYVEITFSSKNVIAVLNSKLSPKYVERGTCSISDLKTSIEEHGLDLSFLETLNNSHGAITSVECNKNLSFFTKDYFTYSADEFKRRLQNDTLDLARPDFKLETLNIQQLTCFDSYTWSTLKKCDVRNWLYNSSSTRTDRVGQFKTFEASGNEPESYGHRGIGSFESYDKPFNTYRWDEKRQKKVQEIVFSSSYIGQYNNYSHRQGFGK